MALRFWIWGVVSVMSEFGWDASCCSIAFEEKKCLFRGNWAADVACRKRDGRRRLSAFERHLTGDAN
jgi:hypothetical protein